MSVSLFLSRLISLLRSGVMIDDALRVEGDKDMTFSNNYLRCLPLWLLCADRYCDCDLV